MFIHMSRALVPVPTNRHVVVIAVEDERSGSGGTIWIAFEATGEGTCRVVDITHNIVAMEHHCEGKLGGSSDPNVDKFIEELDQRLDKLIKEAAEKCDRMEWIGGRPDPQYKP